jgi:hypothetical protein
MEDECIETDTKISVYNIIYDYINTYNDFCNGDIFYDYSCGDDEYTKNTAIHTEITCEFGCYNNECIEETNNKDLYIEEIQFDLEPETFDVNSNETLTFKPIIIAQNLDEGDRFSIKIEISDYNSYENICEIQGVYINNEIELNKNCELENIQQGYYNIYAHVDFEEEINEYNEYNNYFPISQRIGIDTPIIEEDIGSYNYDGSNGRNNCQTFDDSCIQHEGYYYSYNNKYLGSAYANIESYDEGFTNDEFLDRMEEMWADNTYYNYDIETYDGHTFILMTEFEEDYNSIRYVLVWYNGNNIINLYLDNIQQEYIEEEDFLIIIDTYLDMYPSELEDYSDNIATTNRHDITILNISTDKDIYNSNESILTKIKLENQGNSDEEDLTIEISILGFDNPVSEISSVSMNVGDTEIIKEELMIPTCTPSGLYDIDFRINYNDGYETIEATKTITINNVNIC